MTAVTAERLRGADAAARDQSADDQVGDPVARCPYAQRHALEVRMIGEDDQPLAAIVVELCKTDAETRRMRTGADGVARFTGLDYASYSVRLPALDRDAWETVRTRPLSEEDARSSGVAAWAAPDAPIGAEEQLCTVAQGDCIAAIGDRFGFFPDTLWSLDRNAALTALRGDGNVLLPGDLVVIPVRRDKTETVKVGMRCDLRRKGVPETLRIRFMLNGKPRADTPYLLQVTGGGANAPDRSGRTDADGFMVEGIPPSAVSALVTLGEGDDQTEYSFDLGHVDPIDTIGGVQARLNSLGYPCGAVDGVMDAATLSGVSAFQIDQGLEANGRPDDPAFVAALKAAYLS